MDKLLLLGEKPLTKAIAKGLTLFGVEEFQDVGSFDYILIVDGDNFLFENFFKIFDRCNDLDRLKLIYIKDQHYGNNSFSLHPLCFLTLFFRSYIIPLNFLSIAGLAKIVAKIRQDNEATKPVNLLSLDKLIQEDGMDSETRGIILDAYPNLFKLAEEQVEKAIHELKNASCFKIYSRFLLNNSFPQYYNDFFTQYRKDLKTCKEALKVCDEPFFCIFKKEFFFLDQIRGKIQELESIFIKLQTHDSYNDGIKKEAGRSLELWGDINYQSLKAHEENIYT